jgi:hypothetical protein
MIVVIQCAATKQPDAAHLETPDGAPVTFVAHPSKAPAGNGTQFARPDDPSPFGGTWRRHLLSLQADGATRYGLLPACRLYRHRVYEQLVNRLGPANVFVLSAGWGLIASDFPTPYYDITFSQMAEAYKRRGRSDRFDDFNMLPKDPAGPVVFLGGKDYLPLFCKLSAGVPAERVVYYNAAVPPEAPGCRLRRFHTATRTNWHYECAGSLLRTAGRDDDGTADGNGAPTP